MASLSNRCSEQMLRCFDILDKAVNSLEHWQCRHNLVPLLPNGGTVDPRYLDFGYLE